MQTIVTVRNGCGSTVRSYCGGKFRRSRQDRVFRVMKPWNCLVVVGSAAIAAIVPFSAGSQIVPDETLGAEGSIVVPGGESDRVDGGRYAAGIYSTALRSLTSTTAEESIFPIPLALTIFSLALLEATHRISSARWGFSAMRTYSSSIRMGLSSVRMLG